MTLSGSEVSISMKPKTDVLVTAMRGDGLDGYAKQTAKMAVTRGSHQKRSNFPAERIGTRTTVLVNNQRNVITDARTVNNNNNNVETGAKNSELLRCKRKIHFVAGQTYAGAQPASVARRNARERNRVKQVNNGFATLRSHIPPSVAAALASDKSSSRNASANKKLSKVETLKMAVEYIRSLQQMLEEHNGAAEKKAPESSAPIPCYDARFDVDDSYYSSSPDSSSATQSVSGVGIGSPTRVGYVKSEPVGYPESEPDYYRRPKLDNFNREIHDALTSEFYQARSPVKPYYASPERSPPEYGKHRMSADPVAALSPGKTPVPEFPGYDRSPDTGLTVLNTVTETQVLHYAGHAFAQPRIQHHRSSTSLSPSASDACPSPAPSYSSDHSGLHPGSVVSGASSSGHLVAKMSRLGTGSLVAGPETAGRSASPVGNGVGTGPTSPGLEFQAKDSPSDGYEAYEPVSPEDEELLDVISWWQQSH